MCLFPLSLDSILSHWEIPPSLGFFDGHYLLLSFGQCTSDGTGLLGAKVQGLVLLTLKVFFFFLVILELAFSILQNKNPIAYCNSILTKSLTV